MKRPSIKTPCFADAYHAPNERIAEFSTRSGKGGLIRVHDRGDDVVVEIYRCDPGIKIIVPADPLRDAAPDMLAALKALLRLPVNNSWSPAEIAARDAGEAIMAKLAGELWRDTEEGVSG